MIFERPLAFVLIGMAGVFAYHAWLGWSTGIVRLPISVLMFQDFERERSPEYFWGVFAFNCICSLAAMAGSAFLFMSAQ